MRIRHFACIVLVAAMTSAANADVRVCTWNLLQFSTSNVSGDAARIAAYKLVLSQIDADILIVQEISNSSAVTFLRDQIINAAGGPGGSPGTDAHYTAATFSDTGSSLDIALFYRDAILDEVPSSYVLISTSPRDTPRWRIRPVTAPSDSTDLYVYGMHLAATDPTSRNLQTQIVRANANALPAGTHFIYVGDFNIDSSSEASYQNLIGTAADNDGRSFDPINSPGSWSANFSFAGIHTQSPHSNNANSPPGGAGGGLDDRFDFLLVSQALQDSVGFDYVPGSYRAFGNDGNHFNDDINDAPTIPEGTAVANALHSSSDHLPVLMDLTEPVTLPQIVLTPSSVVNFPLALVGGTSAANLVVTNGAPIPADTLIYSFEQPANFQAPVGTFMEPAGGGGNIHSITMDTSTSGNKLALLEINNNSATDSPVKTIVLSGAALEHAIPSATPMNQTVAGMIEFSTDGGEVVDEMATVFNADFNPSLSVPLLVSGGQINNDASGRFSLIGFAPVGGIEDFAEFVVRFDGVGAAPGSYTADLVFSTEDDSALSGATALADVTFALSATIPMTGPLLGDFNMSGVVEPGDIPGMVALLLDPTGASAQDQAIGDMNQDSVNDAADLALFIEAMLP